MSAVRVARHGAVAVLTLHRPEAANAIDGPVLREVDDAFGELESDPGVRAVVVTGAGDRAFSAGSDVRAMRDMTVAEGRRFVELGDRVLARIAGSALTTVAAVGGAALGGGAVLALSCDVRVAADTAVLGFPEVRLGLVAAWGGTQRATRLVGPSRTRLLMLTGDRILAREALEIGLVDEVVPAAHLRPRAMAIAEGA
jgi:enoyl-CoA hydratase